MNLVVNKHGHIFNGKFVAIHKPLGSLQVYTLRVTSIR